MFLLKEIAVDAGWTVKGTADSGGNYYYNGVTSAAPLADQGSGGDYDCWQQAYQPATDAVDGVSAAIVHLPSDALITGDGIVAADSWCVLENDGRELLLRPNWTSAGSMAALIVYARKGSGGFDGSVADASGTIPGPTSTAADELEVYSTRASPESQDICVTGSNDEDVVHFWANDEPEGGARVIGYQGQDVSVGTSFNSNGFCICPIIESAQTPDDPDSVVIAGGNTSDFPISSTSFFRAWSPTRTAFFAMGYTSSVEGWGYFSDSTDPETEPTSGNESIIQVHTGELVTGSSTNEWYKGPITEKAIVTSSVIRNAGNIIDVGFANDEGVYMHIRGSGSRGLIPWPDTSTQPGGNSITVLDATWRGIRGVQPDITPPTITNFSTPLDLPLPDTAVSFEVTDVNPGVSGVYACVRYTAGLSECAYMGNTSSSFTPDFALNSVRTAITDGFRYTLQRNGPWLQDFVIDVFASDGDGNVANTSSSQYLVPSPRGTGTGDSGDVCYVPSIPSPHSGMAVRTYTLLQLRDLAKDLSDMENSDFLSDAEWNLYINFGLQELYDLLAESHDQEFLLKTYSFATAAPTNTYTLPADFHVLKGVDFSTCCFPSQTVDGDPGEQDTYDVQTQEIDDVYTLRPYTFEERHAYTNTNYYPVRSSLRPTMRYRVFTESVIDDVNGSPTTAYFHRIRFNPVQSGFVQVWYLPNVPYLSSDTDFTPSFYGFEEYPAIYAAIQALAKEESDTTPLQAKLEMLKGRIRIMAAARDIGYPGKITDVSQGDY